MKCSLSDARKLISCGCDVLCISGDTAITVNKEILGNYKLDRDSIKILFKQNGLDTTSWKYYSADKYDSLI